MDKASFVKELSDALDKDLSSMKETTLLEELDWDSLSAITFIAITSDLLGQNIDSVEIENSKTIGDLLNICFK